MADKAKHAFGALENIDAALSAGKIDSYDILFVKDTNGKPYVGWIDKDGNKVIVDDSAELAALEAEIATKVNAEDLAEVDAKIAEKVNAVEVDAKIDEAVASTVESAKSYTDGKVEAAINEHMAKKYEFTSVPTGTLVDYRDSEIRVMCPVDAVFTKQSVGTGGDPNSYYATFKTYAPSDDAVGYIEHLNGASDSEILTDISTDEYGRRYQPTWLALAKYDEATGVWNYYGKNSSAEKYIGWDYQIDWYNADGVMIASDCIRINLSNENCHSVVKPYYVGGMMNEVEVMIEEKIAESMGAIEVIEF